MLPLYLNAISRRIPHFEDTLDHDGHRSMHTIFHRRIHRMHHTDVGFDVTTTLLAHPIEALFSTAFRMMVITALGLPVLAVVIAELMIVAVHYFIHANIQLPARAERWIRRVIVTPYFHRVHHSIRMEENINVRKRPLMGTKE